MKRSSKLQSHSSQTENGDAQSEGSASTEVREFQDLASARPRGIIGEFVEFLWSEKRWWLTPIVLVLLVISLFIVLTNTAVGPFIYVLF